jgi:protein-S-isoprenylcysteine O-methyltransferase Ste14
VTPDHPGVLVKPTRLYPAAMALSLLLELVRPTTLASGWLRIALAALGMGIGVALLQAGRRRFAAAGTNVPTHLPVERIVRDGPYRWSRNPIYLGLTAIYLGLAFAFDSVWALALLLPVLVVMRFGVIAREERYLDAKFGAEYRAYRARVRRWL